MMMSKPRPDAENPPAAEKAKEPSGAVADLERRLAMLGGDNDPPPPMSVAEAQHPPAFAAPPPAAAAAAPAAAATGKSALLARIMAAQERAKMAKPKEETPPPDFFSAAAPPAAEEAPPPAFDDLLAPPTAPPPPEEEAPPAFSMLEDTFDMKPPDTEPVAPPSYAMAPPAPSAPTFDLLSDMTPSAPPLDGMEQFPPPPMPAEQAQQSIEEEFAAALVGMSEEEKASLLAEQKSIMQQIEQDKSTGAAALSAADRFDQRSNAAVARIAGGETRVHLPSAPEAAAQQRTVKLGDNQEVALHGQERTREAIADGTAILVQCVNCNNWMQVTDNATLMFCPVCQVVSPVDRENAVATKEEALQMEADRKLAEELQKEEYTAAEREERQERRQQRAQQQQQQAQAQQGDTWWDWLGLGGGATAPERPQPQAQSAPQYRGDMGVSRPPGAGAARLQSAQTGEIAFSGSYDGAEERSLLNNRAPPGTRVGPGGARVAEAKPLFACVADSITGAAASMSAAMNTQTLTPDDEGNVNGVDGSSLLVVSQAGRNQN